MATRRARLERRRLLVTFEVPGDPKVWRRAGQTRGRTYLPADIAAAEEAVGLSARAALRGAAPSRWPVEVEVQFERATARRCDLDNLVKLVMDALNMVVWRDDSQVIRLVASKTVNRERPGTSVQVWEYPE